MKRNANELAALMRMLDEALELPAAARGPWLETQPGEHPALRDTVRRLLSQAGSADTNDFASFPQAVADVVSQAWGIGDVGLQAGARIGPYQLERELGQGGMGSVWLAQRADGAFARTVALKLPRVTWSDHLAARMARERDILSALQHEHIVRFLDAGVDQAGRPYLAMEYVQGVPIDQYCREQAAGIPEVLQLVLQACRALAHAHSRLIVHRDLKPSNILVNAEHGVRLLDFGIASLVSEDPAPQVTQFPGRMLTLNYASPEQVRGEPIGTASDVYSIAVLCYELLTGQPPYALGDGSFLQAAKAITEVEPRLASAAAAPARARALRGDLDAVLQRALQKDPARRYASMAEFADDLQRHLHRLPVRARPDRFPYRARKFFARYRWQAGAAGVTLLAILVGGGLALWQAHAARAEARRASAIKDFLVDILRTDDVRIAGDGPRTDRTVTDMLRTASTRVEAQFAGQPAMQLELLGLIAVMLENAGDYPHFRQLEGRRVDLGRQYFGAGDPGVIASLVLTADAACANEEYADAERLLAAAEAELAAARREDPELRAQWMRVKARLLTHTGEAAEHDRLVEESVSLFRQVGRQSMDFAAALAGLARVRADQGRGAEALASMQESVSVAEAAPDVDHAALSASYINLARQFEQNGRLADADATYRRAQQLAARTWGRQSRNYWAALAWNGRLLQYQGDRAGARALFEEMWTNVPDSRERGDAQMVRQEYGDYLVIDGRAAQAIPILERVERAFLQRPDADYDLREARRVLGNAYDAAGRTAEARERLQLARDEYLEREPRSRWAQRARARWGSFLLQHSARGTPDFATAQSELRAVIAASSDTAYPWEAQAQAGLAQAALARGAVPEALEASELALARLAQVRGLHDLRLGPVLWLVRSAVLLASGDAAGAREWASKARAASLQYDGPDSRAVADADQALRHADAPQRHDLANTTTSLEMHR